MKEIDTLRLNKIYSWFAGPEASHSWGKVVKPDLDLCPGANLYRPNIANWGNFYGFTEGT